MGIKTPASSRRFSSHCIDPWATENRAFRCFKSIWGSISRWMRFFCWAIFQGFLTFLLSLEKAFALSRWELRVKSFGAAARDLTVSLRKAFLVNFWIIMAFDNLVLAVNLRWRVIFELFSSFRGAFVWEVRLNPGEFLLHSWFSEILFEFWMLWTMRDYAELLLWFNCQGIWTLLWSVEVFSNSSEFKFFAPIF